MNDYQLEDTVFLPFTTRQFSDGVPTALSGGVIDIYEDATATPIITGETLVASLNSVVGFNMITVTATSVSGFNADGTYTAILQAGTVGGTSVVGEVVGRFSIERSPVNWAKVAAPTTANDLSATDIQLCDTTTVNTDVTALNDVAATDIVSSGAITTLAGAIVNVDLVDLCTTTTTNTDVTALNDVAATDIVSAGAITTSGGAVSTVTTTTTATNLTTNNDKTGYQLSATGVDDIWNEPLAGHVTADTTGLLLNDWQDAGRLDTILDTIAADVVNIDGIVPSAAGDEMALTAAAVGLIWDELLTGATHNIATSAGRRLRQLETGIVLDSGTLDAATSNTADLETGVASTIDDFYNHNLLVITSLTGVGQVRVIVDYTGTGNIAVVSPPWVTIPDATSTYDVIIGYAHAETTSKTAHVGLAQAGAASSITLASDASSTTNFYVNDVVSIDSGTGEGQERVITAYNGTSKVATVEPDWAINPDSTSNYVVEEALSVADVFAISNDITAADNLELDYDGTGFTRALSTIGTVTTLTGHTAQTADHTAAIADIPTVSEFEARTLVAASYFDPTADAVANVTLTATTTAVTNDVGITATAVDNILDEVFEGTTTLRQFLRLAASSLYGKLNGAATTTINIRDEADTINRVVATVDASGNRSAITLNKT